MAGPHEGRHRHEWQLARAGVFACRECPATTPACRTCRVPLEGVGACCPGCISDARNLLREVRDLYAVLPDVIDQVLGLHAISYDAIGRRGGSDSSTVMPAALVMHSAGSMDADHLGRFESSIDPVLLQAERRDPPSVLACLASWEDGWRRELHLPAAETTTVAGVVGFLLERTEWAANVLPGWGDYLDELWDLKHRLLVVTGQSSPPEKAGVPCPYCAGNIVQRWTTTGLGDIRECDVCHLRFESDAHFLMAIRQAHQDLPATHPDQLVTIADAKRIYHARVRRNTLDQWVQRRRLDERGRDVRGEALYRLGDIDARVQDATA